MRLRLLLLALTAQPLLAQTGLAQTEVAPFAPRHPMTFELVDVAGACPDCFVIQAQGRFVPGTSRAFIAFAARRKVTRNLTVLLHSAGGSMLEGMLVGTGLRALGARTIVGRASRKGDGSVEVAPAACSSACVSALVGGVERAVAEGSTVGVHRPLPASVVEPRPGNGPGVFDRPAAEALLASTQRSMEHFDRMGVDLRLWLKALATPYDRIARLTPEELKEWRVVAGETPLRREPGRPRPLLVLPEPPVLGEGR